MDAYHAYLRCMEYLPSVDPLLREAGLVQKRFEEAVALEPNFVLAPNQEYAYGAMAEIIWRSTGDLNESRRRLEKMGRSTGFTNV